MILDEIRLNTRVHYAYCFHECVIAITGGDWIRYEFVPMQICG